MLKIFSILLLLALGVRAEDSPWISGAPVPPGGRVNLYQMDPEGYQKSVLQGKLHAQTYPVEVTGLLPPLRPLKEFIEKTFMGLKDFNDLLRWVGLHDYPKETDTGIYAVPYPDGKRPDYLMGFGTHNKNGAIGFTVSCAGCHSANLFGKTVLGMTNRFPRGNEALVRAKMAMKLYSPIFMRIFEHATKEELALMKETKNNFQRIGGKLPLQLGLDTSLAQVALSLNRRNPDPWATPNREFEIHPRPDALDAQPADSKPAVWWNLKYKNRWLTDGSVVSGNPIFTNILWNEIGRGADLYVLDGWLKKNGEKIRDLTNGVFSTEAPLITDFFPAEKIDIERAQRGEKLFNQSCAKCHGIYLKNWNEGLKTQQVIYTNTRVVDVGTDSWRYKQMKSLEKLNDLEISKQNGTVIVPQKGYVAPPLVGIWARWPYFHNNSVPSLCAVLTASGLRPMKYLAREANDPGKDFDFDCNGYPMAALPNDVDGKPNPYLFDTTRAGLSNSGHDEGIFLKNGVEILSPEDKKNLIQFMQTL